MAKNKKKVLIICLVCSVIILSIVCIVSIIYNIIGGFYFTRLSEYNTVLGEDLNILIKDEGSYSTACNFSGTIVLNTDVKQKVFVETNLSENSIYLRAKMEVVGISNGGYMFGSTNWIMEDDGYLYLNQEVNSYEKLSICHFVRLNENLNIESNKNYIIIFTVEASYSPWEILN